MLVMVKRKVVKSLKAGSNSREDLEYLQTLTAEDFQYMENPDLLEKWNSLQKTPGKVRQFTFSLVNRTHSVCERVKCFPKWAYIKHDKDDSEHIHYHYYIEFPNPRSFSSVANELGIPVTMLQKVYDKKGILQYLTHENSPDKHHYQQSQIVTNMNFEQEIDSGYDFMVLAQDYWDMRHGKMTYFAFLEKYKTYIVRQSFSSQIKVLESSCKACDIGEGYELGGACPPSSEFRVPKTPP